MTVITRQVLRTQHLAAFTTQPSIAAGRPFSTSRASWEARAESKLTTTNKPHTVDPRWLTLMKRRIGKCMMFGLKTPQVQEAGEVLQQLARDWRELVAGSEGFLTNDIVRGLFRHNVTWGEMDTMVSLEKQCLSLRRLLMANHFEGYEFTPFQTLYPFQYLTEPGHVNNVTYVRYAETARVNFMRNFATHLDPANKKAWINLLASTGIGLILRSIKIDYKFPMKYPDKISVYHKLAHNPSSQTDSSAFELQVTILSEAAQRPAARCHEDIVTYDYRQAKKTALPPFMLEQFQKTWGMQEQAKETWQQRILEIENRVRTLEVESWDREDAVEDTGSAKK